MLPSTTVIADGSMRSTVRDAEGRTIEVRRLTAIDRLRLFKAAGPALSQNQPWLGMAVLASAVTAIDGVPVPAPATEQQIESLVSRLGDAGISAVAAALASVAQAEPEIDAGNSAGTPT
jgi:hypothetical protein